MRWLLVLFLLAPAARAGSLRDALGRLRAAGPDERAAAVEAVLKRGPALAEVVAALRAGVEVVRAREGWHELEAVDEAGATRPYHLYVPRRAAESERPVPLLVDLHGGVARADYVPAEAFRRFRGLWGRTAQELGFVLALPLGRRDCTWWSQAGARHVRAVVRDVKNNSVSYTVVWTLVFVVSYAGARSIVLPEIRAQKARSL
ncbi:MAG: hypothetical protein ACE5JG_10215, partial [Planctomycetota bacterium]